MTTFTRSFNQEYSTLSIIAALRAKVERMYLTPKVKAQYSIVTFSVECDTPHERKILENLVKQHEQDIA